MARKLEAGPDAASPLLRSGALDGLSPKFAEGLRRVREVTDRDGALPAWFKALCMAGAAAVKGAPDVAHRELRRAARLGLAREYAEGAVLALLISRGEAVAELMLDLVDEIYGPAAARPAAAATPLASAAEARGYFERTFGTLPPYVELLASGSPRALEGYFLMREVAVAENSMPTRLVDLFYVTLNASEFMSWNVGLHVRSARKAGASEEELVEAAVCAIPVAGAPAWIAAAEGIAGTQG